MDKRNRKKKTVDDTVCEIHKFSGYAVLSNCSLIKFQVAIFLIPMIIPLNTI